jgi:antibiotic biosynthesis monooxygenase (ABM) superfamily enzyme
MDPNASTAAEHGPSTSGSRQHSGPPRAKLALLSWVGAYAVILVVLAVGGPALAGWPLALRALVVSGLMVAAMTWVIRAGDDAAVPRLAPRLDPARHGLKD